MSDRVKSSGWIWWVGGGAVLLVGAAIGAWSLMRTPQEPLTAGGPAEFRRLDEVQYARSIEDIFGAGIKIPGRFEPPLRYGGLLAIGDSQVAVTPSGLEQTELRAREISAQVLGIGNKSEDKSGEKSGDKSQDKTQDKSQDKSQDKAEDKRKSVLSCTPQSPAAFDQSCAGQFIGKYGRLLFRRPLSEAEMAETLSVARTGTEQTGDFYKGLQAGLARLLVSPNFIFRVERSEPDPDRKGALRLDAYSLASRISFLLWDAPPDTELLDAAESGALRQKGGLESQVDRLIASPRFEQGVRSFFSDMLGYDQFDGLVKDQSLFPKFTTQLTKDVEEQSLRTIVDLLVTEKGDYRDLFTIRTTFLNRALGSLYKVPVDQAAFDGWVPYTFGPDQHRAGLLTLAAFLMLDPTHEGRSSPTIRGKSVRELLLCQEVPAPPPNVNFNLVQDTHNPLYKTARERLSAHRNDPTCAACHAIMDPLGLSMENYDPIANYRTEENGAPIDASGTFDGKAYKDLIGFEKILHDSPSVPQCAAQRVFEYGVGRSVAAGDQRWLEYLDRRFAGAGYTFPALMRDIATSEAFQAVSANAGNTVAAK
jgi:Protein of unknown function (DUF1592)/Protein of unknown function (DUF1588)/Protein of unknown function (DUF1595)/Protein of unknown function (DUF1585)